MIRGSRSLRQLIVAAVVVAATAVSPVGSSVAPVSAAACVMCAGGEYHPVPPTRVLDTRSAEEANPAGRINDVAPLGAKAQGPAPQPTFDFDLLGLATPGFQNPWLPDDVDPDDVLAVVVNFVVVSPGSAGWLAAFPKGSPSLSALVNFGTRQTVANLAIVRPDADGWASIRLHGLAGTSAHVVADVSGWFSKSNYLGADGIESTDERGGRVVAVSPGRVLDTRPGALAAGEHRELTIRGADTVASPIRADIVPDSTNVVGVILNLAVDQPTRSTFISVLPEAPSGVPSTASLNATAGEIKANMVIAPLSDDGRVYLYNHAGSTKLIVDVVGYIELRPDETSTGRVVPLTAPFRAFDTREQAFGNAPLGPGQAEDWSFAAFAGSVRIGGVEVGAQSAVFGNLTVASVWRLYPTVPQRTFLTVYPQLGGSTTPTVSNINAAEGPPVPNMALFTYGVDYKIVVYNHGGYTHYVFDASAVVLA